MFKNYATSAPAPQTSDETSGTVLFVSLDQMTTTIQNAAAELKLQKEPVSSFVNGRIYGGKMTVLAEPKPPGDAIKGTDHHWLRVVDADGRRLSAVVMQWSPDLDSWVQSGNVVPMPTPGWIYIAPCERPPLDQLYGV